MNSTPLATVRVTRHFEASPEHVFDAWIDRNNVGKWLFATPKGKMVKVEIDSRPGGSFTLTERRDGDDVEHVGQYVKLERPRCLVFDFGVKQFAYQKTRVNIDITPSGSGSDLTLSHEQVLPEWSSKIQEGWSLILSGLEKVLKDDPSVSG